MFFEMSVLGGLFSVRVCVCVLFFFFDGFDMVLYDTVVVCRLFSAWRFLGVPPKTKMIWDILGSSSGWRGNSLKAHTWHMWPTIHPCFGGLVFSPLTHHFTIIFLWFSMAMMGFPTIFLWFVQLCTMEATCCQRPPRMWLPRRLQPWWCQRKLEPERFTVVPTVEPFFDSVENHRKMVVKWWFQ